MKTIGYFLFSVFIIMGVGSVYAGPKLTKGNLAFLKGQKNISVEFDYSNVAVGKFKAEEDYIKKKTEEYNKKEPGRGDKWKESWYNDRPSRFEPKFLELFNENSDGLKAEKGGSAEYVMVVKTTYIDPGYNVGVSKKPAYANFKVEFFKANDRGNPLAEIIMLNVPGSQFGGFDFDTGTRISECYGKGAKDLARFIAKSVKK
ncbi:MAG: hypothetical protein KatS3mg031_1673 [Chitinophagales bacterium]|nr:MAG: hypothetical protein KatS3mg031_1673 [Chitinophagales bacterium]